MNPPEKIWVLPYEGSPDTGRFFPSKLAGTTEYVRADIAALNPDAIWNEAIEAAAEAVFKVYRHGTVDDLGKYIPGTSADAAQAISLLKRQQGGNEA